MSPRYLFCLILLAVWGCASTAGTIATLDTITGEKKINPQSAQFAWKVKVEDIIYRKRGGLIEAQVRLTNKSSKSVAVELKGKWYDKQGFEVDDPKELWRHIIINGKETKVVKLVSPRGDAVKLEIIARQGKFEGNY
jgi:uncharacterized protein YcfL